MRAPAPPTAERGSRGEYDAIVIGSGIGGAVTAALLADAGRSVLVLEKNRHLGGILASYEREGFKLDLGSHLISRGSKGPIGAVLRRLGLDRPRFLTHPVPVRARGMFDSAAPPTRFGLLRVAREAIQKMRIPPREALHLMRLVFQIFTLTGEELERLDRITLDQFLQSHTRHPGAYFLFAFLASIFFVLPPYDVAAGEAIRCLRRFLASYSLSYVEGGMDSLPHALLGRVVANDGEIATGCPAEQIRRSNGSLLVATRDGREYRARAVAANMAPADLLPLLDGFDAGGEYGARVRALRPSGNAHQLKIALDRPLVEEGCLIGGISVRGLTVEDLTIDMIWDLVESIRAGNITDPLSVYAPVPTNFDPSLAPPGKQVIVASLYGAPGGASPDEWQRAGMAALASVIPDLEKHVIFTELRPIEAVGRWMGKRSNAAISNGQTVGQVGRDRLPVATPVPGLFVCGDGAGGSGIGTELAATSGVEVAEAILRSER